MRASQELGSPPFSTEGPGSGRPVNPVPGLSRVLARGRSKGASARWPGSADDKEGLETDGSFSVTGLKEDSNAVLDEVQGDPPNR